MFFNSEDARAHARERVAQFRKEAEVRRFTANPRQAVARFLRYSAANLEQDSQGDSYASDRHVSGKISRYAPA